MQEPITGNSQRALHSKAQPNVPPQNSERNGASEDQSRQSPKPDVKPVTDSPVVFPVPEVDPT